MFESMHNILKNPWSKRAIASALGAAAGFAYYYYIGCASGTCPITGNPYISTAYGAAIGFLLIPKRAAEQKSEKDGTA